MTAAELVVAVRESGASLRIDGQRLLVGPTNRVSDEMVAELRAHRAELVDLVSRSSTLEEILASDVEPTSHMPTTTSETLAMPLARFASAGLVISVHSREVGEEIVLASDNAVVDPGERRLVYRAAEIALLPRLGQDALRFAHNVKRYGGRIQAN